MSEPCCGTCKWHERDRNTKGDWVCVNSDSEYCTDWTGYEDVCGEWEEK